MYTGSCLLDVNSTVYSYKLKEFEQSRRLLYCEQDLSPVHENKTENQRSHVSPYPACVLCILANNSSLRVRGLILSNNGYICNHFTKFIKTDSGREDLELS